MGFQIVAASVGFLSTLCWVLVICCVTGEYWEEGNTRQRVGDTSILFFALLACIICLANLLHLVL